MNPCRVRIAWDENGYVPPYFSGYFPVFMIFIAGIAGASVLGALKLKKFAVLSIAVSSVVSVALFGEMAITPASQTGHSSHYMLKITADGPGNYTIIAPFMYGMVLGDISKSGSGNASLRIVDLGEVGVRNITGIGLMIAGHGNVKLLGSDKTSMFSNLTLFAGSNDTQEQYYWFYCKRENANCSIFIDMWASSNPHVWSSNGYPGIRVVDGLSRAGLKHGIIEPMC